MKKKYLENNMKLIIFLYAIVIFSSCSNKYESLQNIDKPPVINTDKDTITMRYKSSFEFDSTGYLKINLIGNSFPGLNLTYVDSSDYIKVYYDGKLLTMPLAVNQHSIIYIGCDKIGQYTLIIKCINALGNSSSKKIIINSVDDAPPIANLNINQKESNSNSYLYSLNASLSSSKRSQIISYEFYIDSTLIKSKLSEIEYEFYKGEHVIGVIAIDDLGKRSQKVQQSFIIN